MLCHGSDMHLKTSECIMHENLLSFFFASNFHSTQCTQSFILALLVLVERVVREFLRRCEAGLLTMVK